MPGGVKLFLDMAIGASSRIERDDKDKIEGIVNKVEGLHSKLQDIGREQGYQRVCVEEMCLTQPRVYGLLIVNRNVKPNFEIKVRVPMQRLCDGRWFSLSC